MRNAEKLIDAIRDRPSLYDQSLQTFKYSGTKHNDWMQVAKIVYGRDDKATVNKVKMQWKSLRDAFVKQQRKRQMIGDTIRPYIYEIQMQFLHPHILMKDRDDQNPLNGDLIKFDVKTEDSVSVIASVSSDSQVDMEQESIHVTDEFIEVPPNNSLSNENVWNQKEMHPVDAFFFGIAQTVKQLKPATIARLKKTVANIVIDTEIEELKIKTTF